jgi:hypothetical protein
VEHKPKTNRHLIPSITMTAAEIKLAHASGKTVYWSNPAYKITGRNPESLLITCSSTKSSIGLTHSDGITLNGKEEDFFILETAP